MPANIIVLGAGMVGSEIARDLVRSKHEVTIVDVNPDNLTNSGVKSTRCVNLATMKSEFFKVLLDPCDLVVNAMPGFLGYRTLTQIINAGKDCVDISFPEEDTLLLEIDAIEKDVTVLVDFGIAPGMCNILLGDAMRTNESVKSYKCMVGGLPFERRLPYQYKAPYSPSDVVEMYTRPARLRVGGENKTVPALSDPEIIDSPAGQLEAFNTDGLRSLLGTVGKDEVPNMVEKTLRWPGHREQMEFLKMGGFFDSEHRYNTECVLFEKWKLEPTDDEFTYMQIDIEGDTNYSWRVFDKRTNGISSMSRTTGYTATAGVGLVLKGTPPKGIVTPEEMGMEQECFDYIMQHLKKRGVNYELHRM